MIFMVPHDSDWNDIARRTGDASWRAENMWRYFQRLEYCRYRPLWRFPSWATAGRFNPTAHGWNGWLSAERPLPARALGDLALICMMRDAVRADLVGARKAAFVWATANLRRIIERLSRMVIGEDDPNDQRLQQRLAEGLRA
jgi:choline dehydrogenase